MMPPENHGSYGGKYSLLTTAFRYAKFIGFSPPKTGCQRSGLAARIHAKSAKPARKTHSVTISTPRSRDSHSRKANRARQAAANEAANKTSHVRISSGRSNGASFRL